LYEEGSGKFKGNIGLVEVSLGVKIPFGFDIVPDIKYSYGANSIILDPAAWTQNIY
jgi:hypothetical protein